MYRIESSGQPPRQVPWSLTLPATVALCITFILVAIVLEIVLYRSRKDHGQRIALLRNDLCQALTCARQRIQHGIHQVDGSVTISEGKPTCSN